MKAFLFGAGASRGTFDDSVVRVPVAAEFGRTLNELDSSWRQNYPALVKVVEHLHLDLADWPLEPVWSCIDYYAKLQSALPLPKPWNYESPQLKKALLTVYGRRCDTLDASSDCTLAKLFCDQLQAGDVLISFNYDTIAERIACGLGRRLVSTSYGASGAVRFAKPHVAVQY
jgi:hypothetical protein